MTHNNYYLEVSAELEERLNDLQTSYDSKLLAVSLLARGAYMLRLLQSANVMSDDDVSAIIQGCIADVHEPTNVPKIITLNSQGGNSPERPS